MDLEENKSLPFLDVLVMKKKYGGIAKQEYRKKTHTDQYLHASSHHHPRQNMGVLNTIFIGALRISDFDHLEAEIETYEVFS